MKLATMKHDTRRANSTPSQLVHVGEPIDVTCIQWRHSPTAAGCPSGVIWIGGGGRGARGNIDPPIPSLGQTIRQQHSATWHSNRLRRPHNVNYHQPAPAHVKSIWFSSATGWHVFTSRDVRIASFTKVKSSQGK